MTGMKVDMARAAAKSWIMEEGRQRKGYLGAYLSGSTVEFSPDAELPIGSDIDVNLVLESVDQGPKLGKFSYRGILVEVTYISWDQISPAETALASYHIAGGFRSDTITDDPTGKLRSIQKQVALEFTKEVWVRRRLDSVHRRIQNGLKSIDVSQSWHDQVTTWLFPTGVTAHLLLVAALRNPTVRLRYLKARQVLTDYRLIDRYLPVLNLMGCTEITPKRVEQHVQSLAITFDTAAAVAKTPFFFSTDITRAARPIAIDASLELVRHGDHREAMFWIVATFARCHKILAADSPASVQREVAPAFHAVLADLGIASSDDLVTRAATTISFLPALWKTVEEILASNAEVTAD